MLVQYEGRETRFEFHVFGPVTDSLGKSLSPVGSRGALLIHLADLLPPDSASPCLPPSPEPVLRNLRMLLVRRQ